VVISGCVGDGTDLTRFVEVEVGVRGREDSVGCANDRADFLIGGHSGLFPFWC
jgi:hypothetical protein